MRHKKLILCDIFLHIAIFFPEENVKKDINANGDMSKESFNLRSVESQRSECSDYQDPIGMAHHSNICQGIGNPRYIQKGSIMSTNIDLENTYSEIPENGNTLEKPGRQRNQSTLSQNSSTGLMSSDYSNPFEERKYSVLMSSPSNEYAGLNPISENYEEPISLLQNTYLALTEENCPVTESHYSPVDRQKISPDGNYATLESSNKSSNEMYATVNKTNASDQNTCAKSKEVKSSISNEEDDGITNPNYEEGNTNYYHTLERRS